MYVIKPRDNHNRALHVESSHVESAADIQSAIKHDKVSDNSPESVLAGFTQQSIETLASVCAGNIVVCSVASVTADNGIIIINLTVQLPIRCRSLLGERCGIETKRDGLGKVYQNQIFALTDCNFINAMLGRRRRQRQRRRQRRNYKEADSGFVIVCVSRRRTSNGE